MLGPKALVCSEGFFKLNIPKLKELVFKISEAYSIFFRT